jgi:hypothetical protein
MRAIMYCFLGTSHIIGLNGATNKFAQKIEFKPYNCIFTDRYNIHELNGVESFLRSWELLRPSRNSTAIYGTRSLTKLCRQSRSYPTRKNCDYKILVVSCKLYGIEIREYGRKDQSRWPRGTPYPQKLALTSPISGGRSVGIVRSRTQVTELCFKVQVESKIWVDSWDCSQERSQCVVNLRTEAGGSGEDLADWEASVRSVANCRVW